MADTPRTRRRSRGAAAAPRTAKADRGLARRFAAFVAERHPFALDTALAALERATAAAGDASGPAERNEALRAGLRRALRDAAPRAPRGTPECTPFVGAAARLAQAGGTLADELDGFLRREAIAATLTVDERRELLRGMILTRAVDNQLKSFFLGGQVRHERGAFQGKGFRSLGQEAIYAAPLRLRRGERFRDPERGWRGDVVAPLIRDLGAALAMDPSPDAVRRVLSAQMGKAGPPMDGTDLHIGDLASGILPASAPLAIPSATVAGLAMGFDAEGDGRVAVSFIGEGGTSLGEWHEAINACAARRWPAIFCVENNQTAQSTPSSASAVATRSATCT